MSESLIVVIHKNKILKTPMSEAFVAALAKIEGQ